MEHSRLGMSSLDGKSVTCILGGPMTVGAEQRLGFVPLERLLPRRTVCFRFNMAARAARVAVLGLSIEVGKKSVGRFRFLNHFALVNFFTTSSWS